MQCTFNSSKSFQKFMFCFKSFFFCMTHNRLGRIWKKCRVKKSKITFLLEAWSSNQRRACRNNRGIIIILSNQINLFWIFSLGNSISYGQWCDKFHQNLKALFWSSSKPLNLNRWSRIAKLSGEVCTKTRETSLLYSELKSVTSDS